MIKNMLNKVRRTKRIRLTNSIRRILEREKLPKDGQLLLVLTRYGRELICRHEISSWKVTDEKV